MPSATKAMAMAATLGAWLAPQPATVLQVGGRQDEAEASSHPGRSAPPKARSVTLVNPSVTASDRQVNVGASGLVTLTSILPLPAKETIVLKDIRGAVVRTLVDSRRAPGTYTDAWDGKGDSGKKLKDDQYRWVARFSEDSVSFSIDYSKELDGDFELKSHPEYSPWDPFKGVPLRFSHTFEKPGEIVLVFSRATYNVSPRCNPPEFFCRFLDGYQPAGEFIYEWAGVDDAGVFRPDIHAIFVISHHEDLARNAIIVYGGRPLVTQLSASPAPYRPDMGAQEVTFSLRTFRNERASALITWMNQESRSVLRTLTLTDVRSGLIRITWDGRGENGARVAPGAYTIMVRVTDALGQEARAETLARLEY